MKIKAIAPWFGGKRNLAPDIVEELGDHRVYWEPFCGSMAVLMVKPPCVMETVNDLHGDLTNLARVIQHDEHGPKLYRRLRRTFMAEELFRESAEVIRGEVPTGEIEPERAYHYFATTWLGRNGVAGTSSYNHHFCARYTANGGHAAKRWRSVIQSIPAWRRRLANVTILSRDAFGILQKIDDRPGTAIYVDPPYLRGTRSKDTGAGRRSGSSLYVHDFTEIGDPDYMWRLLSPRGKRERGPHRFLAELLGRFHHARIVVSYYDDPLLDELYPGWTKRVIEVSKAMANQGSRGKKDVRAREVLLLNGPSYATVADASPQGELFT